MGRNYALNTAQIKRAAELYADGYSRRDIGNYFGCSDSAAAAGLRLAGVKLRTKSEAATLSNAARKKPRRVASVFHLAQPAQQASA